MLRMTSTYHEAMRRTSQFGDSRATPTMTPRIVDRMMPSTLTMSVFSSPTRNARAYVSLGA